MADVKIKYATSGTITCTLAALASSSTIGRGSTSIDNGTNLYDDVLLNLAIKVSGTGLGAAQAVEMYVYGSEDGTTFSGDSKENVGTDAAVTVSNPTNLLGPVVCSGTGGSTLRVVSPVAQFFGGRMPRKWGFVVVNRTNLALSPYETDHTKTYTGITYTVV